jgi:hypothetical protein
MTSRVCVRGSHQAPDMFINISFILVLYIDIEIIVIGYFSVVRWLSTDYTA